MNSILPHLKPKPGRLGLLLIATVVAGGTIYFGLSRSGLLPLQSSDKKLPAISTVALPAVSALGRLEPAGEITQIAAPLSLDGDRLGELWVQVGDRVQAGDPIGVLDSRDRLQDDVAQAQLQVRRAEAQLAQVKAGAKSGAIAAQSANVTQQAADLVGQLQQQQEEIARIEAQQAGDRTAQTATIRRLEAELRAAEIEEQRYQGLWKEGVVAQSLYDSKRLAVDTTQQALLEAKAVRERTQATGERQVQEARAELARLQETGEAQVAAAESSLAEVAEVRSVDVQMVQTELDLAKAAWVRAQKELARATIRAPQAGQILEIYTRPGEQMGADGIVALGQTDQMMAIAEVYQSDISRVQLGQSAEVRGQAFREVLQGEVVEIGRQVSQQHVFSGQPGENLDRRVVEVKIALTPASSQVVQNLSNLQVQVVIAVEPLGG